MPHTDTVTALPRGTVSSPRLCPALFPSSLSPLSTLHSALSSPLSIHVVSTFARVDGLVSARHLNSLILAFCCMSIMCISAVVDVVAHTSQ